MTQIRENVASILQANKFARDDDNTLIMLYWMAYDGLEKEQLETLAEKFNKPFAKYLNLAELELTSTDTIKQARRDLQKEGFFRASDVAVKRRTEKRLERMA